MKQPLASCRGHITGDMKSRATAHSSRITEVQLPTSDMTPRPCHDRASHALCTRILSRRGRREAPSSSTLAGNTCAFSRYTCPSNSTSQCPAGPTVCFDHSIAAYDRKERSEVDVLFRRARSEAGSDSCGTSCGFKGPRFLAEHGGWEIDGKRPGAGVSSPASADPRAP